MSCPERDISNCGKTKTSSPVGEPECKKLKAGRLKEQVPVLVGEVGYPGDAVAEVADHVDGGGEQVVELGDLHRLVLHEARFGLKVLF